MSNPRLRLSTPTTENRKVAPHRSKNVGLRTREHLTRRFLSILDMNK